MREKGRGLEGKRTLEKMGDGMSWVREGDWGGVMTEHQEGGSGKYGRKEHPDEGGLMYELI